MNNNDETWTPDDDKHLTPKIPLFRDIPPSDAYPLSALGTLLNSTAIAMKDAIQAPDALYGQSLLGASALAVQGLADVQIDGRDYPISLYLLSVGASGERKSAIDKIALSPHLILEKTRCDQFAKDFENYLSRNEAWEAARRSALAQRGPKKVLTVDQCEKNLEAVGERPQKPISQMLLIDEPTFEGLQKMLLEGQPSVGLFSDEGGRMFGGHSMNAENQLKTIAGFSKFWDGAAVPRIRAGDGATKIRGKRMSMHLMIQPRIAAQVTGDPVLVDQGILARCLTAFPESTVGTRFYKEVDIVNHPATLRYNARMMELLSADLPMAKGKANELHPRGLALTPEAKRNWVTFHDEVERNLATEKKFGNIRGFGSKAAEHVLRIAAVLTLTDDIHAAGISQDHIECAIDLVRFYLSEALRLHESAILNPDLHIAQRLSDWCQNHTVVYATQIYQLGPHAIRNKTAAQKYLKILEEHGHLKRLADGVTIEGIFRSEAWEVVK